MAKMDINIVLIEEYKNKYLREEFECILSILPRPELLKPILAYPKAFRGYADGFRPQNLPDTILQRIYYNKIYKREDALLATYLQELIDKSLEGIEERISQTIDPMETVDEKIQNDDAEILQQLVDILYETEYRENIPLYFKVVGHELSKEQSDSLEYYIKLKRDLYEIEKQIKEDLISTYKEKNNEEAKRYSEVTDEQQAQIQQLEEQIRENELTMQDLNKKLSGLYEEYASEVESLNLEIDKFKNLIEDLSRENRGKSKKIRELSEILEMEYNSFYKIAEKRWIKSNDQLLKKSEDIKQDIGKLGMSKDQILEDIESLKLQKHNLEEELLLVQSKSGEFIESFQHLIDTIGLRPTSVEDQTNLYTIPSSVFADEIEMVGEREYFIDDLAANLETSGIHSNYCLDLAECIYAIFANKMSLLVVGYNARGIADAVSSVICGRSSEILILPLGYNNCNELISTINGLEGKVILIENAVDNISETTYIPLIKQNTEKFLLFSMETSENIGILPNCIFNYMLPLDIDSIMDYGLDRPLYNSRVDTSIFNVDIEPQTKRYNLRNAEKLGRVMELSRASKHRIAEVMSIIDSMDSANGMYDILAFSISMLCKSYGRGHEFKDFIEKQNIGTEEHGKLEFILGDDLANV